MTEPTLVTGEFRKPRQMLSNQEYDGHVSIHDDKMAEDLALSESRRTESNWIKTSVFEAESRDLVAEVILNSATVKDSYANYEADAKALGKSLEA